MQNLFSPRLLTKILVGLSVFMLVGFFFVACNKKDDTIYPDTAKPKPVETAGLFQTKEKLTLFPSDLEGNPIKRTGKTGAPSIASGTSSTCSDWDPGYISATFLGHKVDIFCEQASTYTVYTTYYFEITTPEAPASTGNTGRVRVSALGWPTFTPAQTFTSTPSFSYAGTYYDPILDADIYRYGVSISSAMTYSKWCEYQSYKTNLTLQFNCSNIGTVTTAYQSTAVKFTPDAYQPFAYYAYSQASGSATFAPNYPVCYLQCHSGSYGLSNKNEINYRVVGTSTWTSKVYNDGSSHTETGLTPGSYEWRSRGIITKSPDVYEDWRTVQQFTVN